MSLETVINRKVYAGNGVTTSFSFPYYFLAEGDLVVIVTTALGVETVQTLTTDYTVSGEGAAAGGSVTMVTAPASGESLVIYRDPTITQGLDLRENDALPAEEVEKSLDRAAMISQRLDEQLNNKVGLSEGFVGSFDTTLPTDIATANATVVVNASANGFDMGPTTTEIENAEANATAAAASAAASAASAVASAASAVAAADAAASIIWNDVVFLTSADSPYNVTDANRGNLLSIDASGGAVTINLIAISSIDLTTPYILAVKKTDPSGNAVTINASGSEEIDGQSSAILNATNSGIIFIPDTDPTPDAWSSAEFGSSLGSYSVNNFSGDSSTVDFTLSIDPGSELNIDVYISGVYQQKDTFSVSGTTLTFSTAPPAGTSNIEVMIGSKISIGTPSDGTVTNSSMATGARSKRKITSVSSTYTALVIDDLVNCDASGAPFTITMPSAATNTGLEITFRKSDTTFNVITITGVAKLATYKEMVKLYSDGSTWVVLDRYISGEYTEYTMNIGSTSTAPTKATTTVTDLAVWRRIGPNMEIKYTYEHTDNTGTNSGSGAYLFPIPSGVTIDSSVTPTVAGTFFSTHGSASSDGVLGDKVGSTVVYNSTNLGIWCVNEAATGGLEGAGENRMEGATAYYSFTATIPIVDWEG